MNVQVTTSDLHRRVTMLNATRVDGIFLHDNRLAELPREHRRPVYDRMARILARIHEVDIDAVRLADYGKHGGFFGRQIARWSRQYRMSRSTIPRPSMP